MIIVTSAGLITVTRDKTNKDLLYITAPSRETLQVLSDGIALTYGTPPTIQHLGDHKEFWTNTTEKDLAAWLDWEIENMVTYSEAKYIFAESPNLSDHLREIIVTWGNNEQYEETNNRD